MIQFGTFYLKGEVERNEELAYHMGVAPDFACGDPIYIPPLYKTARISAMPSPSDPTVVVDGAWTFVNAGVVTDSNGNTNGPGFFLAIYHVDNGHGGECGFLEAYDTWLHPYSIVPTSFEGFQRDVKRANTGIQLQFGNSEQNSYTTQSGQAIVFTVSPHSDIISTSDEMEPAGYKDKFTHGTIIDSEQGSAYVTIRNPNAVNPRTGTLGTTIILDMRDQFHPRRISESGEMETGGVPYEVWVDFGYTGNISEGDFYAPFKTLTEALEQVAEGGTINILNGTTPETPTIPLAAPKAQKFTIRAVPGPVTIGRR